jgi:hypothetical protein
VLFALANGTGQVFVPPAAWLAGAVLATLAAMAGLTAVPAILGGRQPVALILKSEAA